LKEQSPESTFIKIKLESGTSVTEFSTDGTLSGNSDDAVPTEKAVKAYADGLSKTIILPYPYTPMGEIKVPSGDTDYLPPFFVIAPAGQTVKLISVRHRINSGTSATVKVQKNGSDLTGFTGISVTTTTTLTNPSDQTLSDGDMIQPIVTAVSGTPKNMTFELILEYTV